MRVLGLAGMAPGPATSKPHPEHKGYPYLLRGVAVRRPNQVWSTDLTCIRLAHGFAYLVAIIDWYSRRVLAGRLSNTLEAGFCVDCLAFYNGERSHQSLGQRTPDDVYRSGGRRWGQHRGSLRRAHRARGNGTGGGVVLADFGWAKREFRSSERVDKPGTTRRSPCPRSFTLCPHCAA